MSDINEFINIKCNNLIVTDSTKINNLINKNINSHTILSRSIETKSINSKFINDNIQEISIGSNASKNQAPFSIAIGNYAAHKSQGESSIAIGNNSGSKSQGKNSISLGLYSGENSQRNSCISIGDKAAQNTQEDSAIAIGKSAGKNKQKNIAIAIGKSAGKNSQGSKSISIGHCAGNNSQGYESIAIGINSGFDSQGSSSIAIGNNAGNITQGEMSIAIGNNAGVNNQADNSIILNASADTLDCDTSGFFVNPINSGTNNIGNSMFYDDITHEIKYDSSKTFVIDHPIDENKYLVHCCLEGPEAGIYYRGSSYISALEKSTIINLPSYVDKLGTDFTAHITCIGEIPRLYSVSKIVSGSFTVYGEPGEFNWIVYGKRFDINTQPDKNSVSVKGDGPYTWISY